MNWQPIETAPKDGTHLLLVAPERDFVRSGRWSKTRHKWLLDFAPNMASTAAHAMVTHWMPLPDPPKDGE